MKIKRIILSLLLAVPLISAFNIEQPSSNNFQLPVQIGIRGSIEIESVTLDRVPTTNNTTATGVFNFIIKQPVKLIYYFLYCNAHISCLSFNCTAGTIDLDPSQIYELRTSYSVGITLKMERLYQINETTYSRQILTSFLFGSGQIIRRQCELSNCTNSYQFLILNKKPEIIYQKYTLMDKKLQGMHIISSNLRSLHPLHYGIPHIGSHKLAESTLIVYLNELGWVLYQRRSMHNYFVLVIFQMLQTTQELLIVIVIVPLILNLYIFFLIIAGACWLNIFLNLLQFKFFRPKRDMRLF